MVNSDPLPSGSMTPGGVSTLGTMGVSDGASKAHQSFLAALTNAGRRMYWNGQSQVGAPVNQAHAPFAGRALASAGTQALTSAKPSQPRQADHPVY